MIFVLFDIYFFKKIENFILLGTFNFIVEKMSTLIFFFWG